ncbi:hypothetical protein A0257_22220 [Hymenobacter psoromatis]|nr:hypothetical protein A0257_22220 [Hymenobacter psoromatis]
MANTKHKRRVLFFKFAEHLNLLKANGFLKGTTLKYPYTYICPICLGQFSEQDLDPGSPNMLTIEHAPPEASGGHGVALTCKRCNSIAGHEIDFHLTERLREADSRKFLPNTNMQVRATNRGLTVQATINIGADGTVKMTHSAKNNHFVKVEEFAEAVNPTDNAEVNIEFGKIRTEFHRFEIGLLKTAYILAFAKFGYSFLLDGVYNVVREQLLSPAEAIYPQGFWTKDLPIFPKYEGIHLCTTPIVEGLFGIFQITTSAKAHYFGVYLPMPMVMPSIAIERLRIMGAGSELSFDQTNCEIDYLSDLDKINDLTNWFLKVRFSKINLNDKRNIPTAINYLRYPQQKWDYKLPYK